MAVAVLVIPRRELFKWTRILLAYDMMILLLHYISLALIHPNPQDLLFLFNTIKIFGAMDLILVVLKHPNNHVKAFCFAFGIDLVARFQHYLNVIPREWIMGFFLLDTMVPTWAYILLLFVLFRKTIFS